MRYLMFFLILGTCLILSVNLSAQCLIETLTNAEASIDFGNQVALGGDMNNDNYGDIAVSATDVDKVYVYSGLDRSLLFEFGGYGEYIDILFGSTIKFVGDVNNDGHDDLAVGATYYNGDAYHSGKAYIYSGLDGSVIYNLYGSGENAQFGGQMDGIGDVNGDGFDDFIIALPYLADVYLYSGQTGEILYSFENIEEVDLIHISVSGGGDFNNDGINDVIIGTTGRMIQSDPGWVYIYSGQTGQLIQRLNSDNQLMSFGLLATAIGDIDNDGQCDIAISHYTTLVYSGSTFQQILSIDDAGYFTATGDVNSDGYDDLGIWGRLYSGQTGKLLYTLEGMHFSSGDFTNDNYTDLASLGGSGYVYLYMMGDADCDGMHDDIDDCTDPDLDGFGNPGLPSSICPDDNCPYVYNPYQEDTDGDGMGDSCDVCHELVFRLGQDVVFIENTAGPDDHYTASIPVDIKVNSWWGNCFTADIIKRICYDIYYDMGELTYIGSHSPDGKIDVEDEVTAASGEFEGLNRISCCMQNYDHTLPCDYTTTRIMEFTAKCQPNLNRPEILLDRSSCYIEVDSVNYYATGNIDGIVMVVQGDNPCYTCGDFDLAGDVNILDVTALITYLYKNGPEPPIEGSVDVDNSGVVNIMDITAIISYIYKGGANLNCP